MPTLPEFIRVIVIDGVAASRRRTSALLAAEADIEVVGVARTSAEGLQLAQAVEPAVILLAPTPDGDPVATIGQLVASVPGVYLLITTPSSDVYAIQRALAAGAKAFLPHPATAAQLAQAIRASRS